MSGLVSGLQNRVRRFESARNLMKLFQMISDRAFSFLLIENGTTLVLQKHDIRMVFLRKDCFLFLDFFYSFDLSIQEVVSI